MHEGDGFSAKTLGKSLFNLQNLMTGLVMVWPASSDFWKALLLLMLLREDSNYVKL